LEEAILITQVGVGVGDFDHQVDHILTDAPQEVKLVNCSVPGLKPLNWLWDSDRTALFSIVRLR